MEGIELLELFWWFFPLCFRNFVLIMFFFFLSWLFSILLKFQMHDIHQHIHTHISHKLIIQRPCITQHIDLILLNGFVCPPFLSLSEFKESSFYHCYFFSMAQNKPNWPFQITTFHNRITSNKSQSHLEIKRCDRNWRQNIQTMYDLKMKIMSFFPKKFMIPSRFQHLFVFSLFIFIMENFENVNWIVGFNLAFDSFIQTSIYKPRDIGQNGSSIYKIATRIFWNPFNLFPLFFTYSCHSQQTQIITYFLYINPNYW